MARRRAPKPVNPGRPSEYSPDYCSLIRVLRSEGHDISGFCSYVGITRKTYYNWQKDHPEFKEACEISKEDSDAHFNKIFHEGGLGKIDGFVPAAMKEIYNRQHGVVKEEAHKTEINIGNMNVLQSLSDADLQARIAHKLKLVQITQEVHDDGQSADE